MPCNCETLLWLLLDKKTRFGRDEVFDIGLNDEYFGDSESDDSVSEIKLEENVHGLYDDMLEIQERHIGTIYLDSFQMGRPTCLYYSPPSHRSPIALVPHPIDLSP